MSEDTPKSVPPVIINEGTIFRKKDMLRTLETLDTIRYEQVVDGQMIACGQAVIAGIFASRNSATLLVNAYLYLNINSFDYLRFFINRSGETVVELSGESMMLRLTAVESEATPPCKLERRMYGEERYDEETYVLLEEESTTDDDD